MSKRSKEVKELVVGPSGGRVLQEEGLACAKTLRGSGSGTYEGIVGGQDGRNGVL